MKLDVEGLHFAYRKGGVEVLRGLDFHADAGDVVAVLGPNGVGKSTLFRCLLGFLPKFTGSIQIDGRDVRSLSRKELASAVAYVPQHGAPVFDYTLKEVVLMGVTNQVGALSSPKPEHEEKAYAALELMGIAEFANKGCQQVSGGQRQLAFLARALVQDAKILIMDEPTASLDYGNQYRVIERISRLGERGYTVIMSTHDPNQAFMHANRALVLKDGRVLAEGDPAQCLTEELLSHVYGIKVQRALGQREEGQMPFCIPVGFMDDRKN